MLTFVKSKVITFLSAVSAIFMFIANAATAFAAANNPDITTGLTNVKASDLATKIINIATGIGAVAGAIAVAALIYVGFRMATATDERTRAEAKAHMMQILIGLGIIGLAVMVVAFIAFVIKG